MSDNVEYPLHYNAGGIETIDGIRAALGDAFLDYCRGNVIKYVWRCRHKGNTLEDLRKAAKYLEWAIAEAEGQIAEPTKPGHVEGVWVEEAEEKLAFTQDELEELIEKRIADRERIKKEKEEADANASRKIETENTSEAPNSSIPDPGEGYRLLSKEPPEPVVEGDEFLCVNGEWYESENWRTSGVQCSSYYRRKIKPTEWVPKVGDKVRVVKPGRLATGKECVVIKAESGEYAVQHLDLESRNLEAKDLELIEAAQ